MAYDITFTIDLFNGDVDAPESLTVLNILANALMQIDILSLRLHPATPNLYESNVRYSPEAEGQERWQGIPTTLRNRMGDCEDLAAWRAAELNVRHGIAARPLVVVSQRYPDQKRLYHVVVERPDGSIEDPSFLLGMRKAAL